MTIYVNIGSNQGDRQALIEQAVALIADAHPGARIRRSDYIESEPWGYDSPHPFLNLGVAIDLPNPLCQHKTIDISDTVEDDGAYKAVEIDAPVDPHETMERLLAIQNSICADSHRNPDGSYRDRQIDIDLIAIDRLAVNTETLVLPHPLAHQRSFVMAPLGQLAPPSLIAWLISRSTTLASS